MTGGQTGKSTNVCKISSTDVCIAFFLFLDLEVYVCGNHFVNDFADVLTLERLAFFCEDKCWGEWGCFPLQI